MSLVAALIVSGCGTAKTTQTATGAQLPAATATTTATTATAATTTTATTPATRQVSALSSPGLPGSWHLRLNAEFRGRSLNTKLWRAGWFGTGVTGPIDSDTEVACYSSANTTLPGDDLLHISVSAAYSTCEGRTRAFTGGLISTDPSDGRRSGGFQFRYGVLKTRVYFPRDSDGQIANWPGLLMLGQHWPDDGEDDIFEGVQSDLCSYFRSPGRTESEAPGGCRTVKPGWHTFMVDWQPGRVTWYYDNRKLTSTTEGITSSPMYIVLVNSVQLQAEEDAQPGAMKVAYVRVWQRKAKSGT